MWLKSYENIQDNLAEKIEERAAGRGAENIRGLLGKRKELNYISEY